MTRNQFRLLHSDGIIRIPRSYFSNNLPSCTDPTQDIPVKNIMVDINGNPLNVKDTKLPMSNLPIEKMTTLEKRNNDKFDVLGELQDVTRKTSSQLTQFKTKTQKQDEK